MSESQNPFHCFTGFRVGNLHTERSLSALSPQQLKYATYLSLASWAGFPILLSQVSVESPSIHTFLSSFISIYPFSSLESAATEPNSPLFYFLEYAAQFYYNGGNFMGFGDTKFIPRISQSDLSLLLAPYPSLSALFASVSSSLYSEDPTTRALGWPPENVTAYYFPRDFRREEQEGIDSLLKREKININNTMIRREATRYNVKTLSIVIDEVGIQIGEFNKLPVFVTKGWHSEALKRVNHWLTLARDSALSELEAEALTNLIIHNETGDVSKHWDYTELWIKESSPIVESYIGVIENYRDPSAVRCEWEGFVAAVNPEESRFLHKFVGKSEAVLPLLPYPKSYEKTSFSIPSYNAIDILTFCVSAMPVGINLPNYDEIRITKGFKNVSLSNVLAALRPYRFDFLTDDVLPSLLEDYADARTLGIAAHELYGHGSGTLLKEEDIAVGIPSLLDPSVNVETFYLEGETFQGVFGGGGPPLEECRAESTALHLAYKDEVLEIFGVPTERRFRFKVNSTLVMLHNGLQNLGSYIPELQQWKQAHSQARFAILKAVLNWGKGAVEVKKIEGKFKLIILEERFEGVQEAIELLLKHLNYYKAARLPELGNQFMKTLTSFDDFWLEVREQSLLIRPPRPVACGVTIVKNEENNELTLVSPKNADPTILDVFYSITQNVKIAAGE
jgi:dipeptidyl-peptidase-3